MTKKKTKDPSTYFMITCTSKIILDAIVDASGKVVGVMTSCCVFAFQYDASTFATNPKRSVITTLHKTLSRKTLAKTLWRPFSFSVVCVCVFGVFM